MHSHHSHSGTYVSHAVDSLDDIVEKAAAIGFKIFCLTEHMPRLNNQFLYPEELEKSYTTANLSSNFTNYLQHAQKLQSHYNAGTELKILIGFEVEGIDLEHIQYSQSILDQNPCINMTVGSVHYVHLVPIDFSAEQWLEARTKTKENTTRALYRDYFDLQYQVISTLKPLVIGHFDLIRLFEPIDEIDPTTGKQLAEINIENDWPDVWQLVVRNIEFVGSYGGLFELNSAAIRKGWSGPYPKQDMCEAIKKYGGGRFCLSDDSHGLKQIGLNFKKTWTYVMDVLHLEYIYNLDLENGKTIVVKNKVEDLNKEPFFK
ncbi:histidinol phosphate phosphatase H [Suhomyces tanzawaensis NRRL Y-17324]|uniref:Histidinol-phosphatase n=1 Tax=Suhomyces tanzawaensis NRRL Y-17324 TaxID=984487 RepID=A0A1E4SFN1_9ASCO|nr:histidinol phosphate phosphatase H [Suhomyces tanzawaensis NRRL Y-17324]ODV78318.1 histidinol phosphate phosphatase H [Suhomyces tanzawaensis NRRL Y-17324]